MDAWPVFRYGGTVAVPEEVELAAGALGDMHAWRVLDALASCTCDHAQKDHDEEGACEVCPCPFFEYRDR